MSTNSARTGTTAQVVHLCEPPAAKRQYSGAETLSVVKEPRIAQLLPLYLKCSRYDDAPLILHAIRSLQEVIQSLLDRDECDPGFVELLRVRSIAAAEFQTRTGLRAWVELAFGGGELAGSS